MEQARERQVQSATQAAVEQCSDVAFPWGSFTLYSLGVCEFVVGGEVDAI
jgi:hypothetical protein